MRVANLGVCSWIGGMSATHVHTAVVPEWDCSRQRRGKWSDSSLRQNSAVSDDLDVRQDTAAALPASSGEEEEHSLAESTFTFADKVCRGLPAAGRLPYQLRKPLSRHKRPRSPPQPSRRIRTWSCLWWWSHSCRPTASLGRCASTTRSQPLRVRCTEESTATPRPPKEILAQAIGTFGITFLARS